MPCSASQYWATSASGVGDFGAKDEILALDHVADRSLDLVANGLILRLQVEGRDTQDSIERLIAITPLRPRTVPEGGSPSMEKIGRCTLVLRSICVKRGQNRGPFG